MPLVLVKTSVAPPLVFRQRILAYTDKLQELPRREKINGVLEIEKRLLEIETEALEFGLKMPDNDHDEPPLTMVFREGEHKLFVEKSIVSWLASRRVLADVFKSAKIPDPNVDRIQGGVEGTDVIVKELEKYHQENGKLIRVLTEELLFLEKVSAG